LACLVRRQVPGARVGCSQGDFRARFSQRTKGSAGVTTRPGSRCSADGAPGRRRTSARPAGRPPARPAPAAWPAPSRTAAPRRAALEAHPGHAHCGGRGAVEELARVERAAGHAHRLLHHPRRIDAGGGPRGGLGLEPRIAAQRQRAGEPRRCSRWPKLHLTRISLRAAISRLLVVLSSYRPRLGFSR